ncbi:arylsulfotransferase family protein [Defluviimonas sp. SAOS-178_SWC]|uniref:arylsulfotransferase family protein n=1 Tax=Defluviimonas sp. SAOS-178_SWC TaxID=3121287 RepID=UPI0032218555
MQRLLFAKIEFWVVLILFLIGTLGAVGFGAAVLDGERETHRFGPIGPAALDIAEIPDTLKELLSKDLSMAAFVPNRFADKPAGWTFAAGAKETGYVLLSRYDGDRARHIVELVSLADGMVKHSWAPDADSLLAGTPRDSRIAEYTNWNTTHYRAIHPILTENGALIIKDHQSFLFALDACSKKVWGQTELLFHHSTESDGAGGWWIPSYIEPSKIERVSPDFVEDSLAHIGADGTVLENISAAEILLRHGMEYALFTAGRYQKDPIHINDIQPVLEDGPHWKKGDLFLSFRHLSMLMLYRPSTDEIVWQQQGPWLAQHDVDILDSHRIAVFNNNAYDKGTGARVHGTNEITAYDFDTGQTSNPWVQMMEKPDVKTLFEGLFRRMPDGNFMVEEENSGRLLILSPAGDTLAEFINKAGDGLSYRLGWSRYMSAEDGDAVLAKLGGACAG